MYAVTSPSFSTRTVHPSECSVGDAIVDLKAAFAAGKVPNSMADDRYYNIRRMQSVQLR